MAETVVFAAFLLGGIVHSTAGFGSALVSMPILTLAVAPIIAAPLQNAVGLLLSAYIFYQHRQRWPWRDSIALILFSLLGIPLGTYVLIAFSEASVLAILGAVLLAYAMFELLETVRNGAANDAPERSDPFYLGASVAGLLSGILGAAYATNGPPAIVYGSLRRWPRAEFKSVLQSLFLINGIAIVLWQGLGGLFTFHVAWYALFAIPGLLLGAAMGMRIDRRLDHARFRTMVVGLLVVLGAVLVARAWGR